MNDNATSEEDESGNNEDDESMDENGDQGADINDIGDDANVEDQGAQVDDEDEGAHDDEHDDIDNNNDESVGEEEGNNNADEMGEPLEEVADEVHDDEGGGDNREVLQENLGRRIRAARLNQMKWRNSFAREYQYIQKSIELIREGVNNKKKVRINVSDEFRHVVNLLMKQDD